MMSHNLARMKWKTFISLMGQNHPHMIVIVGSEGPLAWLLCKEEVEQSSALIRMKNGDFIGG